MTNDPDDTGVLILPRLRPHVAAAVATARLSGAPRDLLRRDYVRICDLADLGDRDRAAALSALDRNPLTRALGYRLDAAYRRRVHAAQVADLTAIADAVGVLNNP